MGLAIPMKRTDPRVRRAERLLTEALRLLAEIKAGVPAPRRRRKRRRRYALPGILAALREGADIHAATSERDPRLPSRGVLGKYRKANAAFGREVREIMTERQRKAAIGHRNAPTPGATVWAKRLPGRNYDWDAILAEIEAGAAIGPDSRHRGNLPSHTLIRARRKADPIFGARVEKILTQRMAKGPRKSIDREAVIACILRGAVIKAKPPEPGMPAKGLIDRDRRDDPGFDAEVRRAIAEARRRRWNRVALEKAGRQLAWVRAEAAVPRAMDPETRSEVVAELCTRLLSGEVGLKDDLQRAWRACRTMITGHRWRELSLDAPVPGMEGLRRIDLLADESVYAIDDEVEVA